MEPVIASAPSRTLAELETVIERGLSTFVDVGTALAEIRDSRLYRGSHSDFDAYCRDRWGFSRRHSSRLITAAQIAEQLGPVGPIPELSTVVDTPLPTSERQVRELARVVPEQRAETWQAVVEQHGEKPTAEQVRRVVQERYEVPTRVLTPTSFVPGPMAEPIEIEPVLPEPASSIRAWVHRLPEQKIDALADMILDAQLPTMVEEVVLGAAGKLLKVLPDATKEVQRIDWERVTDEMRSSETVVYHIDKLDQYLTDFLAALQHARLPIVGMRRVK
jgi:hypothetical protein